SRTKRVSIDPRLFARTKCREDPFVARRLVLIGLSELSVRDPEDGSSHATVMFAVESDNGMICHAARRDELRIVDCHRRLLEAYKFVRLPLKQPDELVGFEQSSMTINDPQFIATSGMANHSIVRFNGKHDSRVAGTVFGVSDAELAQADQYEPAGYKRILATLSSGKQAWVYADALGS